VHQRAAAKHGQKIAALHIGILPRPST